MTTDIFIHPGPMNSRNKGGEVDSGLRRNDSIGEKPLLTYDCVNCGKQNIFYNDENPREIHCLFCHEPLGRRIHQWKYTMQCDYIERRECDCGCIRFFPMDNRYQVRVRADRINKEYGRKGKGHSPDEPEIKEVRPMSDKAARRVAKEKARLALMELKPVPAKPATKNPFIIQKYYEDNKDHILTDLDLLVKRLGDKEGEKAMLQHWGISQAAWGTANITKGIRNRWRPEVYGAAPEGKRKNRDKRIASPDARNDGRDGVKIIEITAEDTSEIGPQLVPKNIPPEADEIQAKGGSLDPVPVSDYGAGFHRDGYTVPSKPDTSGMNTTDKNIAMHLYWEENREEILNCREDFIKKYGVQTGENEMRKLWGMPRSTWGRGKRRGLRNRWLPEIYPLDTDNTGNVDSGLRRNDNDLPDFPTFDNNWPESVQVEWLKQYSYLKRELKIG